METLICTTGIMDTVSEFINSNVIPTFLIAIVVIILSGVIYGTKLWHDIREVRKSLDEMESGSDKGLT